VVCTPEVSSIRDADRVIGLLYARSIKPRLIINRIVPKMVENGDMLSHEDVLDVLSVDLLGLVVMDDKVVASTNTGNHLILQKDSAAGQAFQRIGLRLDGHPDLPIENPMGQKGFWKKLSAKFRQKN
jgi:septum site-determining protein MinD